MNKILLVTGGSRGIGAATAQLAAERGYSVCVNYRRQRDAAERVVKAVEAQGRSAIAVAADVSVEADVVRLFETCDAKLGTLTALVNNVGIVETQMRVEQMDCRARATSPGDQCRQRFCLRSRGRAPDVHEARRRRRARLSTCRPGPRGSALQENTSTMPPRRGRWTR